MEKVFQDVDFPEEELLRLPDFFLSKPGGFHLLDGDFPAGLDVFPPKYNAVGPFAHLFEKLISAADDLL